VNGEGWLGAAEGAKGADHFRPAGGDEYDADAAHADTSYFCDQSDPASLLDASFRTGDRIDFMIDDGSHQAPDQVASAKEFVPLLSPGGIYVIEDVLDTHLITPHLPYAAHIEYFKISRDPWSKLMVIHAAN